MACTARFKLKVVIVIATLRRNEKYELNHWRQLVKMWLDRQVSKDQIQLQTLYQDKSIFLHISFYLNISQKVQIWSYIQSLKGPALILFSHAESFDWTCMLTCHHFKEVLHRFISTHFPVPWLPDVFCSRRVE